jgi:hypothetical protein
VDPSSTLNRQVGKRHGAFQNRRQARRFRMLWIILLVILALLLIASVPVYPYSRNWGYGPGGLLLILVIVLAVLLLTGVVAIDSDDGAEATTLRIGPVDPYDRALL